MKRVLWQLALSLVFFIFIINLGAMKFYWYAAIPWFDQPMHFLGGLFLAIATGALLASVLKSASFLHTAAVVLASVLLFGLLWELFEYGVQSLIRLVELANISDSVSDLFFDLLGGLVGTFFVYRAAKRYNG